MMEYCNRKRLLCFKKNSAPVHCVSFFLFFIIIFFWVCVLLTASSQGIIRCPSTHSKTGFHLQGFDKERGRTNMGISFINGRRILTGPGSSPPRCTSKCGNCTPCKPVHVPVPPGTPVTTEYYPEAWRCQCGNKLYMP